MAPSIRAALMPFIRRLGTEVVQRSHASTASASAAGICGSCILATCVTPFKLEGVHLCLEGGVYLRRGAGEVDHHAAGATLLIWKRWHLIQMVMAERSEGFGP